MKPSAITTLLQRGLLAHQAGRLAEARSAYQAALKISPQNPDALHLLGVVLGALGELDQGIKLISQALRLQPRQPDFHFNLGNLLLQQHSFEAATNAYRSALALNPKMADVWMNLGLAQTAREHQAEARESWQRSLALDPKRPDVWLRLAQSFHDQNQLREAEETYAAAATHLPHNAAIACNLGNILREQLRFREAADSYRRAVSIDPGSHESWNNLGIALQELGQIEAAIAAFQQSIRAKPDYAEAYSNLAPALQRQNRLDEAIAACRRAIVLNPLHDGACINLGNALLAGNHLEESLAAYRRAQTINPGNATARKNEGIARLLSGDLRTGFAKYEARWEEPDLLKNRRDFACARWDGGPSISGRSILLHAEQGLGDTIQFVRYASMLAHQNARVILEAPLPLLELLSDLPGLAAVFPPGASIPPTDFHCPLLSLPFALRTDCGSIPAEIPYLHPRPSRTARWQTAIASLTGLKVGVVWAGNPNHKNDHNRSIPLQFFRNVFARQNISFVSLLKEVREEEKPLLAECPAVHQDWLDNADLADAAGLIQQLDLVISVDTSIAHLAGALGRPTWILLPFAPDWRWLLNTDRSPWYPGMRLFRQPRTGDWQTVLADVSSELTGLTASSPPTAPVS